jgi:hypothetical protein
VLAADGGGERRASFKATGDRDAGIRDPGWRTPPRRPIGHSQHCRADIRSGGSRGSQSDRLVRSGGRPDFVDVFMLSSHFSTAELLTRAAEVDSGFDHARCSPT